MQRHNLSSNLVRVDVWELWWVWLALSQTHHAVGVAVASCVELEEDIVLVFNLWFRNILEYVRAVEVFDDLRFHLRLGHGQFCDVAGAIKVEWWVNTWRELPS